MNFRSKWRGTYLFQKLNTKQLNWDRAIFHPSIGNPLWTPPPSQGMRPPDQRKQFQDTILLIPKSMEDQPSSPLPSFLINPALALTIPAPHNTGRILPSLLNNPLEVLPFGALQCGHRKVQTAIHLQININRLFSWFLGILWSSFFKNCKMSL